MYIPSWQLLKMVHLFKDSSWKIIMGLRIHFTMHRQSLDAQQSHYGTHFQESFAFHTIYLSIFLSSPLDFQKSWSIAILLPLLSYWNSEIELLIHKMLKHISTGNSPMWFWVITFKIISIFSFSDALLYCLKTSFRAFPTLAGVFDASYASIAEKAGWGSFRWKR